VNLRCGWDLLEISPMTWMIMLASEACESTLVMRTLHSWKSSSFIRSLMAYANLSQRLILCSLIQ